MAHERFIHDCRATWKLIILARLCCCAEMKFCNKCHALENNKCCTEQSFSGNMQLIFYSQQPSIIPWGINSDEATINGLVSGGKCQCRGCISKVWRLEWGGCPCALHHQLLQLLALHIHQPPVIHCVWCSGHGWALLLIILIFYSWFLNSISYDVW